MEEIDELERSNTKRFVFGIGALVLIGAAIAFAFRSKGIGAEEQDKKILVVHERNVIGLDRYAADLGFDPTTGTFEAWQEQVAQRSDGKLSTTDVHLEHLLEFADRYGYGYVVLEHPQQFADELTALQIEQPAEFEAARFAVVSVGDFADPHVLSIEPIHEGLQIDFASHMLMALFAQPRLTEARDANTKSTDIQTVRLALDGALDAIDALERQIQRNTDVRTKAQAKLDGIARVDGKGHASSLQAPFEEASVYALADGRLIVRSDGLNPVIHKNSLEWSSRSPHVMQAIAADAPARADARVACPEFDDLRDGGVVKSIKLSTERDTMFVLHYGDVGTLYELDASAGPCGLRSAGELSLTLRDNSYVAVGHGRVGVRDHQKGTMSIRAYAPGAERPLLDLSLRDHSFSSASSLVWLDQQHLVALARPRDSGVWSLVFVDIEQPERPWVVPLVDQAALELEVKAVELQRIPGAAPALLLRWQDDDDYVLSRLDFPMSWPELVDAGIEQAIAAEQAAAAELAALAAAMLGEGEPAEPIAPAEPKPVVEPVGGEREAERVEGQPPSPLNPTWTTVVKVSRHMRGYDVDLAGRKVAYTMGADDKVDVAMVALPGPGASPSIPTMLVADETEHREVSFRPGHEELLFLTRLPLVDPKMTLTVAHALAL